MPFPAESIPDGAILAPHHATLGALALTLVCAVVWDDYRDLEPLLVAVGLGMVVFGFLFVWPYYPVTGAVMALLGNALALVAVASGWVGVAWVTEYGPGAWVAGVAACLVIADDLISHAFGVPTPLDSIWKTAFNAGLIH